MDSRLKKLVTAGGPVVQRLVEHMVQRDASQRKTVQVQHPNPALQALALCSSEECHVMNERPPNDRFSPFLFVSKVTQLVINNDADVEKCFDSFLSRSAISI